MTPIQLKALKQLVNDAVVAALAAQAQAPVQAPAPEKTPKPAPKAQAPATLTPRHLAIIAAFKKRGIADPKLFVDIKPFGLWLKDKRIVRKGQHGVKGLFHISQTDPLK
jgi:hypothetical protein